LTKTTLPKQGGQIAPMSSSMYSLISIMLRERKEVKGERKEEMK